MPKQVGHQQADEDQDREGRPAHQQSDDRPCSRVVAMSKYPVEQPEEPPRAFLGDGRSSMPHRAGLRVSALIDENTVAVAMVMANCR